MVWPSATPHTTPGSPPWATTIERATTIDRPDRPDHLDLGLWLWTLAGWTALRGFPQGLWGVQTPQDQKKHGPGSGSASLQEELERLFHDSAPQEGTVTRWTCPFLPLCLVIAAASNWEGIRS